MIYDILEKFKELYEKEGERLILGAYNLKDGLYVKINKEGKCEYFEAKTIKKEKIFTNILGQEDSQSYNWFKEVDYYSSYLNSNKALFDKKIHNINYLSLYFKAENDEYVKEKIREHFLTLLSFKKFKDKKEKEILVSFEKTIKSFKRKKDIVLKYRILESIFDEITQKSKDLEIKNYVKIFFDEDLKKYKNESEIYLSLKIFNDIKYNQKIEDKIVGLSNGNMGLNSKKPFLENKTRKLTVPFLIENENALFLKKFFDWLKLQPYRDKDNKSIDRYIDEDHFFIQKQSKNDESEIINFDYIPLKSDDVKKHFKPIYIKNYLKITKDKKLIEDYEIKSISYLEQKVNELFYNNQLIFNYYKDSKDIKVSGFLSKELQSILLISKFSMNNYFRKYDESSFLTIIEKFGTAFILDGFLNSRELKAKEAVNLKFAILENKGEKIVNIEVMVTNLELRLKEVENNECLTKEEFLFLSGQWAYYLLSQSKASDRTFSLAEHYFRVKSIDKLKYSLKNDLNKYKHAISRDAKKIRKTISLITSFNSDKSRLSDSDLDVFLVGFTVENVFYKKNKETKKDVK
jgi:CRISPR-associated protein Csh1